MVILQVGRVISALLRGELDIAAVQTRALAILVHDDVAQMLAALQSLLPFWHLQNADIDRILVVKLDRIGDMVNTTPVFDALRSAFPRASWDIIGHPTPLSLLDGDDRIAQRIPYRSWLYHPLPIRLPGWKSWSLVLKLLWQRYPLVVYLRGSFPFLLLAATSRLAAAKFVPDEPVIARYLKPLESLFSPILNRDPRLQIKSEHLRFARNLLFEGNAQVGPRIAIHAAASTPTKMWPIERFAALADELHRTFKAQVHFFGSPEDRPVLEQISRLCVDSHSFHWSLTLQRVVAVVAACDLFIGNDSGLAHVAAALGTPMVVIWGSANLNESRPTAAPARCVILYNDVKCRAICPEIYCANSVQLECLLETQVADIVEAAKRLLRDSMCPI